MAQVVSFQPLTVSHVRFVVDKSGIRTCFCWSCISSIPWILWSPKIYYCVCKSLSL